MSLAGMALICQGSTTMQGKYSKNLQRCVDYIVGKCRANGLLDLRLHDLREHTSDVHRTVDDSPFGGGAGMVMKPEPIFASVEAADPPRPLFLLGPGGRRFDQSMAHELAELAAADTGAK
jgi:tRNA (guanine37-N1)-methyltransferase